MEFSPPLQPATLIGRYKRFLADVSTPDGQQLTLHCPNTGAMTGCGEPGSTVWYSTSDNPKRKYPHTWELTQTAEGAMIGINTLRANQLVKEAILADRVAALNGYTSLNSEVKYGTENSRIDLLLQAPEQVNCYIEVKSVTLSRQQGGFFPDAVTTRGQKHLRELINVVREGERAVLFFAVMHSAISVVSPARDIDPAYTQLLSDAYQQGVEIMAWRTHITPTGMTLEKPLPVHL